MNPVTETTHLFTAWEEDNGLAELESFIEKLRVEYPDHKGMDMTLCMERVTIDIY